MDTITYSSRKVNTEFDAFCPKKTYCGPLSVGQTQCSLSAIEADIGNAALAGLLIELDAVEYVALNGRDDIIRN